MIGDKSIDEYTPPALAREVTYLQQITATPTITAERLVLHGRFPYTGFPRRYSSDDLRLAESAMRRVGILELRSKPLQELSGGEIRRVWLAMALAQDTGILLLDEPVTHLDIRYAHELLRLIRELCDEGKSIVTVLHDINSALSVADFICVLDGGSVAFYGTPAELLETEVIEAVFGLKPVCVRTDTGAYLVFPFSSV